MSTAEMKLIEDFEERHPVLFAILAVSCQLVVISFLTWLGINFLWWLSFVIRG
jgi:hypothetical protein